MKNIILPFLLTAIFCSCENSSSNEREKQNSLTKQEKSEIELNYEIADKYLRYDAEKVALVSIIKNIPQEKTNSILRDYLAKSYGLSAQKWEEPNNIIKIVDSIAIKNRLSKKQTASIIFSYLYEMITKDEIIDDYKEEMEDSQSEMEQY
ncbi:hypothetical protein Q4566_16160 [Tamlana sp. 2_MG-2023]|uniref:hypothetical protein n=1 Tax=unclassified Tamlana TaxID=2614803 RepID=UPI0026E2591F|nr:MULTISPECIES: hypothetical protein [unclassified Tamlana]MDO6761743.1 hypothetical protein [Tamlana sp. 2_MG-2023]MDO6792504.1 hypothetical protein [Tamlana sp. 1_MG-2023]